MGLCSLSPPAAALKARALAKSVKCGYLFLARGEKREKERKRNINVSVRLLFMHPLLETWLETQAYTLTGNQTGDPLVCRPALNPLSHTGQGSTFFLPYSKCLVLSCFLRLLY